MCASLKQCANHRASIFTESCYDLILPYTSGMSSGLCVYAGCNIVVSKMGPEKGTGISLQKSSG